MVIWWNDNTGSNKEKIRPLPRGSSTWSTRGVGTSPSKLIELSFLQFNDIRTFPSFFGIATIGLEYGEVECWMRPAARHWSSATAFWATMGLMRYGWDVTGALSGGTVILNGIRE